MAEPRTAAGPWRTIQRAAVAVFVCAHLGALLVANIIQVLPQEPPALLDRPARAYMHATALDQRWNMFAPQVSDTTWAPVLLLIFTNGTSQTVPSSTMPPLLSGRTQLLDIHRLPPEQRACAWNVHLMDGRLRKFESYACKPGAQYMALRTAWTRWMLDQWLADHPGQGGSIRVAQFARAEVVYDGDGPLPRIDSLQMLAIEQRMDPRWPLPHTQQLPGVMP